jgi:plastocyanin
MRGIYRHYISLVARRFGLLLLIVGILTCGGGDATDPNTTVGDTDGPRMTIEGRSFGSTPDLAPGDSMTIVNLDSVRHTFTAGDNSWPSVDIAGDAQATFTVPDDLAPGDYTFFCQVHADMGGTLTVTG